LVRVPLFIISTPALLVAQHHTGIALPTLNARSPSLLEEWLARLTEELCGMVDAAPFTVGQIVRCTNARLEQDLPLCVNYKVPVVTTSPDARADVIQAAHGATSGHTRATWRDPRVQPAARFIDRLRHEYQTAPASVAATVASAPPPALISA